MDRNQAGVLIKAQERGRTESDAYAAIRSQIKIFNKMARDKFGQLWGETAAARPTGNFRSPYARRRQWEQRLSPTTPVAGRHTATRKAATLSTDQCAALRARIAQTLAVAKAAPTPAASRSLTRDVFAAARETVMARDRARTA